MNIQEIRDYLKKTLPEKRYRHILGTEETAVRLGRHYQEDIQKLSLAALLHDCAKYMNKTEQLQFAKENRIHLSSDDLKAAGIIHAKIGAYLAKKQFQVRDRGILDAISFHSTGAPGMDRFQKILFASDYLEPTRGFSQNEVLKKMIIKDFEKAIFEIIKRKLLYVLEKGEYLHPLSLEFYNTQLDLLNNKPQI
jgi:predicted HD superfamily hydrolase involved in NAD metabolism